MAAGRAIRPRRRNQGFHRALAIAAKNPMLLKLADAIWAELPNRGPIWARLDARRQMRSTRVAEHELILRAIASAGPQPCARGDAGRIMDLDRRTIWTIRQPIQPRPRTFKRSVGSIADHDDAMPLADLSLAAGRNLSRGDPRHRTPSSRSQQINLPQSSRPLRLLRCARNVT